jgi:hypothetical protein
MKFHVVRNILNLYVVGVYLINQVNQDDYLIYLSYLIPFTFESVMITYHVIIH